MKSVADLLNVLPLDGFTQQAINDVLAGFANAANSPPLDRLAAGYFATNPNATSATFKSGNLTIELARFDPTTPLTVAAAEIPPIPGAPADAVAFCAVKPFDASVASANNLTGASTSVGISGADGVAFQVRGLAVPVKISIPGANATTSECVYYNTMTNTWATDGCNTIIVDGTATCQCNHLTEFGMRFKAIADTNAGIFASLDKLGTIEGILAALPVILLLGSLGAALIGTVIMMYRLDVAAFRKYANLLDSSAEFELLRGRVGSVIGDKSWDQLNRQNRTQQLRPGLAVPVPPTIPTRWYHLISLWLKRMPYQHPWLSLIFRFDPQMPRIYRGILITASILTSVSLSILFYGYSNGSVGSGPIGEPTIIETLVLSLITTATSLPLSKFLFYLSAKAGVLEFSARYAQLNVELTKIRNFLSITQSVPRHLLISELDRLEKETFGKTLAQNELHIVEDIYAEPGLDIDVRTSKAKSSSSTTGADAAAAISGALDGDTETSVIVSLLMALFCCRRNRTLNVFRTRLRSFIQHYAHVHTFKSRGGNLCGPAWLPIHTPLSAIHTLFLFIWMGGCATYILGFTSYQSSAVALSIFKSVGISLATSNLIVVPVMQAISLLMPYLHFRREGPEEAIYYPLEIFSYKVNVEFVAQASLICCMRDQAARSIIVASPTTLMKKVELELGEESLRIESRVQNLFWAID
jgi:hypothetical protein